MPRENKTKYAILGLIANKPMSGYDIKKKFEERLGKFWNESYGQIYPILKALENEGLATRSVEHTKGKPARNVITITEKGMNEFKEWLKKPTDPHKERLEILLKLTAGSHMKIDESIRLVEEFRDEWAAQTKSFVEIEQDLQREWGGRPQLAYMEMAVDCGMRVGNAYIEWCNETIAKLEAMKRDAPAGTRDM